MSAAQILHGICVVLTGLVAGLLYGYQCSVIAGLGKLNDRAYLQAFQNINAAILNPVFFTSFLGSLICLFAGSAIIGRSGPAVLQPSVWLAAGTYAVGVFGVTVVCNVPLNEQLARADVANAGADQLRQLRQAFEPAWNRWHQLRTAAAAAAFVLLIVPLLRRV